MKKIAVINGPNLNLLGLREVEMYGNMSLVDIKSDVIHNFSNSAIINWFQSNSESKIIDFIQKCLKENIDGILINPAGFTHTSVAIFDALTCFEGPVVEVHLSNTYKRESFRQKKITSSAAVGIIEGFGADSYLLGVKALLNILKR